MKVSARRVLLIVLACCLLIGLLSTLSFCTAPKGLYESRSGAVYRMEKDRFTRLGVETELTVGSVTHEITVDIVYTYETYLDGIERRIRTELSSIVYEGDDPTVATLVASFNCTVANDGAKDASSVYEFATLRLQGTTDSRYARGIGTVMINDDTLKKYKEK